MPLLDQGGNIWRGSLNPTVGELAALWSDFSADVIIGHPTFKNHDNIPVQLAKGIAGAAQHFAGRRVSFVVSDGTWTTESGDTTTVEAALGGAREALAQLTEKERANIQVIVTAYEGYAGNTVPGKGSALKMIFDEMARCDASMLILLDGDLRNDMAAWQQVFCQVEAAHQRSEKGRPYFVTARYARHFVDASLTRFIVGPLTTLMGQYVPGGISGDIVLSAEAVAHERASAWTEERMRYGTDISTTFDNIADDGTLIYEVYLGAKLHDITDEGKLSVMPGEVIGAALERLLYWEAKDGRVTKRIETSGLELDELVAWGPEKTGIDFVDPGHTDAFNVDTKINTLVDRYQAFAGDIRAVQGDAFADALEGELRQLEALKTAGEGSLRFLNFDSTQWIGAMQRAVAYALVRRDVEKPKRCLNYLYTAAFLEFVKDKLAELGYGTVEQVRRVQGELGVAAAEAKAFYTDRVDEIVKRLALDFYAQRSRIAELMRELEA